jgi:hypothetical protein
MRRPRWVTVLAVLMLLTGASLFFGGLTDLRRLATGRSMADVRMEGLADADKEVLIRGQLALDALGFLFAVAAVFSDDPRAGRASVLAAWAGTAVYGGMGAFVLVVVRKGVADALPVLQQVAAKVHARTGDAPPSPADLAQLASTLMIQMPLLSAALGVLFSVVLLVSFGGRRGRLFYNGGVEADHG